MTARNRALTLAALLMVVTLSGCIALGRDTHTINIPPLRNGATAEYEGYPDVPSGPVQFRIHADHAPLILDGSSNDCIRGTYTFTNGSTQMVCLSYQTFEPLVGSLFYPQDQPYQRLDREGVVHIFSPVGLFSNEILYIALQATGRSWSKGDAMEASWFGVPITFKAISTSHGEVLIETQISYFVENGTEPFGKGAWDTRFIRFSFTEEHPFPIWFGSKLVTGEWGAGEFRERAHANWATSGEGAPLAGSAFDWHAHQSRLVPYEQGWPPEGNPADCAGRLGPERFVELAVQHAPEIGRRLQQGTLLAYDASKPSERQLELRTVTEASGQWAFSDGTKQSYRIEIQESRVYGDEVTVQENPAPPKRNKHPIERFPIRGLEYCEAVKVLDTMRPGRSLVQYEWAIADGAPETAWVYDLEARWGDSSGPFMSYTGGIDGNEVALVQLQNGFITDPPPMNVVST